MAIRAQKKTAETQKDLVEEVKKSENNHPDRQLPSDPLHTDYKYEVEFVQPVDGISSIKSRRLKLEDMEQLLRYEAEEKQIEWLLQNKCDPVLSQEQIRVNLHLHDTTNVRSLLGFLMYNIDVTKDDDDDDSYLDDDVSFSDNLPAKWDKDDRILTLAYPLYFERVGDGFKTAIRKLYFKDSASLKEVGILNRSKGIADYVKKFVRYFGEVRLSAGVPDKPIPITDGLINQIDSVDMFKISSVAREIMGERKQGARGFKTL